MLSTRIFSGIHRTCQARSAMIQSGIREQRRCNSNNAQNRRNLGQKICELMYPTTVPSHCLELSARVEQINTSETLFPDRELAKAFRSRYEHSEDFGTFGATLKCQEIIINYLQVASEMQSRGLIPLVHGQSAIWMIPQHISKTLGFDRCQLLRLPEVGDLKECGRMAMMIDAEMQRRTSHWLPFYNRITFFKDLDLQPEFASRLLSVTIGLFHCEVKNASLSFVFGGSVPRGSMSIPCRYPGNRSFMSTERCKEIADRMITKGMNQKGFSRRVSENLIQEIQPLYEEAEQAEIGQLIVLGIPRAQLA